MDIVTGRGFLFKNEDNFKTKSIMIDLIITSLSGGIS